jgi:curved DNA-binding protein CbpA
MPAEKNYYTVLGITQTAVAEEIKHAYRLLAMKYHPDRNHGEKLAEERFKEIQEAYQVLSDTVKRKKYDAAKRWNFSYSYFQQVRHYFIVSADKDFVRLNEELTITYTYTGEGRFFQKPAMTGFYIAAKPFVAFKKVLLDGIEVKETSLEYTLAPLQTGDLVLGPASIRIQKEVFVTESLKIHVAPSGCFYKKGAEAGNHPYHYDLNSKIEAGTETHHVTYHQNHTLLIPRSEVARYYHIIGSIIKIGCAVWGFFLFSVTGMNEAAGFFAGSVFGGICCHVFYFITGVKSKFYYSNRYPPVISYMAKGYEKGKYSGSELLSGKVISWLGEVLG